MQPVIKDEMVVSVKTMENLEFSNEVKNFRIKPMRDYRKYNDMVIPCDVV